MRCSFLWRKISLGTKIWLAFALIFSPLAFCHAYIDPSTGSYAIQVIIGVVFGGTYAVKSFGGRIVEKIKSRKKTKEKIGNGK